MLFLQYPPCSTCKKAKAWLDAHGMSYTARNIKEENPAYDELKQWLALSGLCGAAVLLDMKRRRTTQV